MQARGEILEAADLFVTVSAEKLQRFRLQEILEAGGKRLRAEQESGEGGNRRTRDKQEGSI